MGRGAGAPTPADSDAAAPRGQGRSESAEPRVPLTRGGCRCLALQAASARRATLRELVVTRTQFCSEKQMLEDPDACRALLRLALSGDMPALQLLALPETYLMNDVLVEAISSGGALPRAAAPRCAVADSGARAWR